MPQIIPVVIGIAAGFAAGSLGLSAAIAGGLGLAASLIPFVSSAIGLIVSTGASLVMGAINKPKAARPTSTALAEDRKQLIRGSNEPRQIVYGYARVSGAIVYAASSGANLRYLHLVVVLATHKCEGIDIVWLNNQPIRATDCDSAGNVTRSDHPQRGRVRVEKFHGEQTAGSATLASESPDGWSTAHALLGCTYVYLRLEYDQERMPGLNSLDFELRGKSDIYDPRADELMYTDNWALCVLDYMRSGYGLGCADSELDLDSFSAAANLSDENVTIAADGGTQVRFTCSGSFKLDRAPLSIMEDLLSAGGGALVYVQGRYRLHGAAYSAPTASIGPADMAGECEATPRAARRELFNGVRGTFIDPARNWQAAEFGAVFDTGYDAQDGGERVWKDIQLPFTTDNIRAQRLARTLLLRARQSLRVKVPMKYAALRLCVWQMVSLTHPDLGLDAKPMRIIDWDYEPETGRVVVEMQAEASSTYAWVYDYAYSAPSPPDTTLIDPLTLPTPAAPTLTASTVLNADGSIIPSIVVTWTAVSHAFVTGMEVQWREDSGAWSRELAPVGDQRFVLWPLVAGRSYEVRLVAVSALARSATSTSGTATALGDATVPAVISSIGATATLRGMQIQWDGTPPRDIDRYQVFERADTTGSAWVLIGETYSRDFLRTGLAPGSGNYRYAVKSVDRSGNISAMSAEVIATPGQVVNGDLAAGSVPTAAVQSDAITTQVSATATTSLAGNGTDQTAVSMSFTLADARVGILNVSMQHGYAYSGPAHLITVVLNGSILATRGGSLGNDYPAFSLPLSLGSGSHTVTILWNGGTGLFLGSRTIIALLRAR